MRSVAIIPARAGSVRIPGKNMKMFHGKPIIQYSIETAQRSRCFDQIIVTTDSMKCLRLARELGVTGINRPPQYAKQECGTQEVAKSVLKYLPDVDMACVIYATAPMMSSDDLIVARASLTGPYIYSVGPNGQDAGQFYWGWKENFLNDIPLDHPMTKKYVVDPKRVIDINTPEDWEKAERMYIEGGFNECGN